MEKFETWLDKFLDTFFHLPTLIVVVISAGLILWQMYEVGLNLGNGFVRLRSNQGDITLNWTDGCCELDW